MSDQGKYQIVKRYYLPGGDIHFTAGNGLFRVHRYFFERESPKFQELISRPLPPGTARPGVTAENPIHLADVTSEQFQKFLWVFYNPKYSYEAKLDEWADILDLACRWKFPEIKELALRQLDQFDVDLIDRIVLYQLHSVDEDVLIPLYAELCAREHTLSLVETEKLGYQTAVMVFHAREQLRSHPEHRGKSPLPDDVVEGEVHETVRDLMRQFSAPSSANDNRKSISPSGWAAAYEEALATLQTAQPRARKLRRPPREGTDTTPTATHTQTMSTVTEVTTPRASECVESEASREAETETTRVASEETDGGASSEDVAASDTKSRKSLRFSRWSMISGRLSIPPLPGSWS